MRLSLSLLLQFQKISGRARSILLMSILLYSTTDRKDTRPTHAPAAPSALREAGEGGERSREVTGTPLQIQPGRAGSIVSGDL